MNDKENMKNYKVVCRRIGYWGQEIGWIEYYYNWYWLADTRSWIMHNIFGYSCNTYVRDGANVKHRLVVWK